jgi:hypothetical protein
MCELLGFADSASAFESRIVTAEGEVPLDVRARSSPHGSLEVKPVDLRFDLLLRITEPLLDGPKEFIDRAFGFHEVVVGKLAPNSLCLALD